MPEPFTQPSDVCSYERQAVRPRCSQRRYQLLLGVWLSCSAFTWPGRVPHLSYSAAHGSVPERVAALRLLEEYPSQASSDVCLAGLEDSATEVRTQAARCVGAASEARAATNLLDLAVAKEPLEREAALEALGRLAPARALSNIEAALADPQPAVRIAAARALPLYVRNGSIEIGKLTALLSSDLVEVRLAAVALLEEPVTRDPSQGVKLLQLRAAARDQTAEVRSAALRGMGHVRSAQLLPDLLSGTSDPDQTVRLSAIAALGDSNLAGAVSPLRTLVSGQATDTRAVRTALAALGRIDDSNVLTAIAPALTRPELAQSSVNALTTRARRLNDTASLRLSAAALQHAIDATRNQKRPSSERATFEQNTNATLDTLARGVIELAPYSDVQPALLSLTQALEAGMGEVYTLTQQLIELRAPQLLPALLERQKHSADERLPDALMSAIETSSDAPALIAAHREQLLQFAQAHTGPSSAITKLHALLEVGAADGSVDQRRALAELWAQLPTSASDQERTTQLVRWLDDADPRVRERSSVALGRTADDAALHALAERLERGAPHAQLSLQACAGAMLRASQSPHKIPSALRERLLQQFRAYLAQSDEAVAMSALWALRATRDQRSAGWIAGVLRGTSLPLRAAAVQALGDFDQTEARRMLRDMLRGDNIQGASNAALALAELGIDRDVEALLRAAERGSWPLPPAAAYAAARITQRGATRKHSLERVLCRFAQLRDAYVLTNSVSALAALGADACDQQINPGALLDPALPSALRVAAALWLQSTRPHSPQEDIERIAQLARCAADHDGTVAAACGPRVQNADAAGQTLLRLSTPDGQNALRSRIVALRQPDATVFIAQSDSAGQVLLPRAPSGAMQLEDPADQATIALPARVSTLASP